MYPSKPGNFFRAIAPLHHCTLVPLYRYAVVPLSRCASPSKFLAYNLQRYFIRPCKFNDFILDRADDLGVADTKTK